MGCVGGPEWGVQGASEAGKAPGPCTCWHSKGRGLAWGQAPGDTRHGALEKSATLCLCAASQRGAPRGKGGCRLLLSSVPIPGTPVSLPRQEHPSAASHWGKTRAVIKAGGNPLPRARQPAAIPVAEFLRCCPKKRNEQGEVLGSTTGKPCKGQLLMAMGQQRDLGLNQILCHEPGYPWCPWYQQLVPLGTEGVCKRATERLQTRGGSDKREFKLAEAGLDHMWGINSSL